MDKIKRDNQILRMAAFGNTAAETAASLGIPIRVVRYTLNRNREFVTDRSVPAGMRARTAGLLLQTIGIWPENANAHEIAERRLDFLRGAGTSHRDWEDVETWLIAQARSTER